MTIKKCWCVFHFDSKTVSSNSSSYNILSKEDAIRTFYLNEDDAMELANNIAAKHPGTQVLVLEAKFIFEAKIPDTVAKSWKDNGELLPIERPHKEKKVKIRIDPLDAVAEQLNRDDRARGLRVDRAAAREYHQLNAWHVVAPQANIGGQGGQIPDPNRREIPELEPGHDNPERV